MNVSPLDVLGPVFRFLDRVIADYGVYLFLVFVWLCLILIVWVLKGGLRRKQGQGNSAVIVPGVIFTARPPAEAPPTSIISGDVVCEGDDDNSASIN